MKLRRRRYPLAPTYKNEVAVGPQSTQCGQI